MGSHHLMSALLLLLVASSGSHGVDEFTTDGEPITDGELIPPQLHFSSTQSPPANKLEGAAPASTQSPSAKELEGAAPASTQSPSANKLEGAAPASSTVPDVTSVPVTQKEVVTSDEPMTVSSGPIVVASTEAVTTDVEVHNVSLTTTPTTELNHSSAADADTIPAREDIVGSESPPDDTTNPSTSRNETDSGDGGGDGTPDVTDGKSDPRDPSTTSNPGQDTSKATPEAGKGKGEVGKVIIIAVIIFILVVLLLIMIFLMLRKKKRSGSFRTHSKKNAKRDVWAGQVPELGDGKAAQDPALVENGTGGAGLETVKEEEMITFVTGEKKVDSMIEMDELGSGGKAEANGGEKLGREDAVEEKTPLLEEDPEPEDPAEQFPAPPAEQQLMSHEV